LINIISQIKLNVKINFNGSKIYYFVHNSKTISEKGHYYICSLIMEAIQ
jgi:hypothetical protein